LQKSKETNILAFEAAKHTYQNIEINDTSKVSNRGWFWVYID
jgi:hypothetical protein